MIFRTFSRVGLLSFHIFRDILIVRTYFNHVNAAKRIYENKLHAKNRREIDKSARKQEN